MNPEARIKLGRITTAHGLAGEVNYVPFNQGSELPFPGMKVILVFPDGKELNAKILSVRHKVKVRLLTIKGFDDRTASDRLKGVTITCQRSELPAIEPDEFYYEDVIGLPVRYPDGTQVGTVADMLSLATDVIAIKSDKGEEWLIPVVTGFVRTISATEVIIEAEALEMD
jgi:16S rRNA processing protein RimM